MEEIVVPVDFSRDDGFGVAIEGHLYQVLFQRMTRVINVFWNIF